MRNLILISLLVFAACTLQQFETEQRQFEREVVSEEVEFPPQSFEIPRPEYYDGEWCPSHIVDEEEMMRKFEGPYKGVFRGEDVILCKQTAYFDGKLLFIMEFTQQNQRKVTTYIDEKPADMTEQWEDDDLICIQDMDLSGKPVGEVDCFTQQ